MAEMPKVAQQIAERFGQLREVMAVALGGSTTSDVADSFSDLDFYIYTNSGVPVAAREAIAAEFQAADPHINMQFWETSDEWVSGDAGVGIDLMYRNPKWIADQIDRVLVRHEASIGYSTCFVYNVRNSVPLFDPSGWYATLQQKVNISYPNALRQAIIAKNYPILRSVPSSFLQQIEIAATRNDSVSLNHRVAALLASYFDVLFALNGQPHPGEKRMLAYVEKLCPKRPPQMRQDVTALVQVAAMQDVVGRANRVLDGLDDVLRAENIIGSAIRPSVTP